MKAHGNREKLLCLFPEQKRKWWKIQTEGADCAGEGSEWSPGFGVFVVMRKGHSPSGWLGGLCGSVQ